MTSATGAGAGATAGAGSAAGGGLHYGRAGGRERLPARGRVDDRRGGGIDHRAPRARRPGRVRARPARASGRPPVSVRARTGRALVDRRRRCGLDRRRASGRSPVAVWGLDGGGRCGRDRRRASGRPRAAVRARRRGPARASGRPPGGRGLDGAGGAGGASGRSPVAVRARRVGVGVAGDRRGASGRPPAAVRARTVGVAVGRGRPGRRLIDHRWGCGLDDRGGGRIDRRGRGLDRGGRRIDRGQRVSRPAEPLRPEGPRDRPRAMGGQEASDRRAQPPRHRWRAPLRWGRRRHRRIGGRDRTAIGHCVGAGGGPVPARWRWPAPARSSPGCPRGGAPQRTPAALEQTGAPQDSCWLRTRDTVVLRYKTLPFGKGPDPPKVDLPRGRSCQHRRGAA